MRILLVDDSPLIRELCRESLETYGFAVTVAADGEEAIAAAAQSPHDAVLCDLQMPGKSGIDVVRVLKAQQPDLPVIIFTEHSELGMAVHAMREGAFGYLLKGTPDDAMCQELEVAASHKRLREDNRRLEAELERLTRLHELGERKASLNIVIAGLAHEINNPLAVLVANHQWTREAIAPLVTSPDTAAELTDVLKSSRESTTRIARIIADLERLLSPTCAPGKGHPLACKDEVERTLRTAAGPLAEVSWEVDPELPEVAMSPKDLSLALGNLVANAGQAVSAGDPRVVVRGQRAAGGVCVEVADNGCGMSKESLKRLGTPFFTTRAPRCTGLGFCLVEQTVKGVGGSVSVTSNPGAGTTVRLWLPIAGGPPAASVQAPRAERPRPVQVGA